MKHLPLAKRNKNKKQKLVVKKLPRGLSIDKRPSTISSRTEFGHWEMDCIESCKKEKTTLLCLTERLSRHEIIFKLPDKRSSSVIKCLNILERRYGKLFTETFNHFLSLNLFISLL